MKSTGRTGWYFRVFNVGFVERVLPLVLVLIDRPFPQWTVVHACEIMRNRHEDRQAANELASCPLLSEDLRIALSERQKKMNLVKQCVKKMLKNFRIISLSFILLKVGFFLSIYYFQSTYFLPYLLSSA